MANRIIDQTQPITDQRIANARRFDEALADLGEYIFIPPRPTNVKQVFHTYVVQAANRDGLLQHLLQNGIDAKVHYPIPLHLQEAAAYLGYQEGAFPVCERHCKSILTLPVHQHLTSSEMDYVIEQMHQYYSSQYVGGTLADDNRGRKAMFN